MVTFNVKKLADLQNVANKLLAYIGQKPVVAFYGKMGAGKTTLIKAICKEMGVLNTVTSPTFALVNEYSTQHGDTVYHFDFYRVNKIEEIFDMGYDEYFYSGHTCLIEWPELAEQVLLPDTLKIHITVDDKECRAITVEE